MTYMDSTNGPNGDRGSTHAEEPDALARISDEYGIDPPKYEHLDFKHTIPSGPSDLQVDEIEGSRALGWLPGEDETPEGASGGS